MTGPNKSLSKGYYGSMVTGKIPTKNGSAFARAMLFSLILIVGVGPRISLSFVDAEIRIQDILIPFLVVYLVMSPKPTARNPLRRYLGILLPVFLLASALTVLLSASFFDEVGILRRLTFYGRTLEMFVLSVVVAGLFLRSGRTALKVVLNAISIGAICNLIWFLYQAASGLSSTLFGQEVSSQIESYGPRLIGEPSAFGVGQYWVFIAAVSAANIKARRHIGLNTVLLLAAFGASVLTESRISMGNILLIVGLLFFLGPDSEKPINVTGAFFGVVSTSVAAILIIPTLGDRFAIVAIESSFKVRIDSIWLPHLNKILQSPIIGIGPGGLIGEGNQSEAHNIIIRAMLDFGPFVGIAFLSLFLVALIRSFRIARLPNIDIETRIIGYIAFFSVLSTLISGLVQDSLTGVMSSHLTMISIGIVAAQWAENGGDPSRLLSISRAGKAKRI